jgi:riboflavin synthase
MFTGIIEALGSVRSLDQGRLIVDAPVQPDWSEGESIAVNGCCLTLLTQNLPQLTFDLSPETLERTNLGSLSSGSKVNLERAMRAGDRFGGHIVQGHIDTHGKLVSIRPEANSHVFTFEIDQKYDRYLIDKGSVTLDGISLTVVEPEKGRFDTWVIPHTLENTNLSARKAGDTVNVEIDVLAKHLEKLAFGRQS